MKSYRPFPREAIQRQLDHVVKHSPYYGQRLSHVQTSDIISPETFSRLPFTSKEDICGHEENFLCVSPSSIVEHVTTSGTTGDPVHFMLSESDLQRLAKNEAHSLRCAGVKSSDIIQIMVTLDKRFMAGLAYHLGARQIGAGIVRTGVESLLFQIDTIQRMKPTVLIAVPSFLLKLWNKCEEIGYDFDKSSVRRIICIGESIRDYSFELNALGHQLSERWSGHLLSTYASTEMATAFTECIHGRGGHHAEELIYIEVLDDHDQPVEDGECGELVVTPLGIEAMPLIRFRTGDLVRLHSVPCACGHTGIRIGPVEGRKSQMLKFKGTTFYPPAIFDVLNRFDDIDDFLVRVEQGPDGQDDVMIYFTSTEDNHHIKDRMDETFRSHLRVVIPSQQVDRSSLRKLTYQPMARKRINFIDNRSARHVI